MDGYKVVESEQRAECFDCCKVRPIYAVQKVLKVSTGGISERNLTRLEKSGGSIWEVPDGWHWQPTCRLCYEEAAGP